MKDHRTGLSFGLSCVCPFNAKMKNQRCGLRVLSLLLLLRVCCGSYKQGDNSGSGALPFVSSVLCAVERERERETDKEKCM